MNAGKSLKVALAKNGLNQKQLAAKMGVSTAYICRLASKEKMGMGAAIRISEALGMRVGDFLSLGDD